MIYINKIALLSIENEIQENANDETGGILLGYYFKNEDMLITHAFPPGPKSIKSKYFFIKDFNYSKYIQKKYFNKYGVDYLGEWHKHINNDTNFSQIDYFSMVATSLVNKKKNYFVIVGKEFNNNNNLSYLSLYSVLKKDFKILKHTYEIIDEPEKFILSNKNSIL